MQIIALFAIFLPLAAAIINGFFGRIISRKNTQLIACVPMIIASLSALYVFYYVGIKGHIVHFIIHRWLAIGQIDVNWAIYIDSLSCIMLLVVTLVSTVVHIYSLGYMKDDSGLPKFLSYLSLFTFFMIILVLADNFLQLFVGWEGVGLCSYLLIGFWYDKPKANSAAIKAFIVNRVGDCAFILGIIMIIIHTGDINFNRIFANLDKIADLRTTVGEFDFATIDIICLLLFIGCMGKSAQIGLHVWLPDAMEGPTPVSALIHAATMVTAGIFLVARCSFLFEHSPIMLQSIAIVGGITSLFAATIAIVQSDIKKIIAYSTCSQLGYMFLACGVSAYQNGIFHLVTHAFFKALLFLSAGSVIHVCHEQNIFKMGGLRSKMPITYLNFWIGSFAIIGIFPLSGFYSKDLILESVYNAREAGKILFIFGIIAAILTAIYSMKIIILVFHGKTNLSQEDYDNAHEAPLIMNLPQMLLIIGSISAGAIGYYLLNINDSTGYFKNSIAMVSHSNHDTPTLIHLLPLIVGVIGMIISTYIYKKGIYTIIGTRLQSFYSLLQNGYFFDYMYSIIITKPLVRLSNTVARLDYKFFDRLGPAGFTKITQIFAVLISRLQTGYIFNYVFVIILSIIICMTYFVYNFIKMMEHI